ncbi:MAG: type II secretion system protein [Methylomonas sp.]
MKYSENTKATQSGMTLIELSVVLLVMVGLAGVAVPYVAGMADKAHDSTTGSTISQLNQTIASFRSNHNALPDRLETLVDASGLYSKLISEENYQGQTFSAPIDLGTNGLLSLKKAGMTNVLENLTTPLMGNATYGSTNHIAAALESTTQVAPVAPLAWGDTTVAAHLAYALGGNASNYPNAVDSAVGTAGACYTYIGMGIGDDNEMVGTSMQSAPILFMPNGDMNPEKKYARYIAIFKVHTRTSYDQTCPDSVQPASFVGTVASMDFGALVGSSASQQWSTSSARQAN